MASQKLRLFLDKKAERGGKSRFVLNIINATYTVSDLNYKGKNKANTTKNRFSNNDKSSCGIIKFANFTMIQGP